MSLPCLLIRILVVGEGQLVPTPLRLLLRELGVLNATLGNSAKAAMRVLLERDISFPDLSDGGTFTSNCLNRETLRGYLAQSVEGLTFIK